MFITHVFNYCRQNHISLQVFWHKLPLNWLAWWTKRTMHFLAVIFYSHRENRFSFCSIFPSLYHRWNLSLVKPSAKQQQNPCSGSPPVYQDLSTCHEWLVKKAIVDLPISMKGNLKHASFNMLSPLGAQNNNLSATSQTLLTKVKLCLWRWLNFPLSTCVCFYSLSYPPCKESRVR